MLVASLVGCSGGETFCTYASYEAPQSEIHIRVHGNGTIPAGADHSTSATGTILMCPLNAQASQGIRLALRNDSKVDYHVLGTGINGTDQWDWSTEGKALRKYLELAGANEIAQVELDETARIIAGVMAGPKGTVLEGQTNILKVLDIDYRYDKCGKDITDVWIQRMASCD